MSKHLSIGSAGISNRLASVFRSIQGAVLGGLVVVFSGLFGAAAWAQTTVSMAQVPLLALKSAPGLVMLTMSRDHRLYYAAYNDTSDLDGDGTIDIGFKPNLTITATLFQIVATNMLHRLVRFQPGLYRWQLPVRPTGALQCRPPAGTATG